MISESVESLKYALKCYPALPYPLTCMFSATSRAGFLPQNVPLQMICYLPQEKEFLPWHASSRALYQLDKLLDRTEDYSLFSVGESPTWSEHRCS